MVGRSGRSKGCASCRKRHLKCDEARPTCERCRRDRFSCDGYTAISFVNEYNRLDKPNSTKVLAARQTPTFPPVSYNLQPVRSEQCLNFLRYLFSPTQSEPYTGDWPGFHAAKDYSTLSYQCLDSLAKSYFGRAQASREVLQDGLLVYVRSLKALNQRLADRVQMVEDDTLGSIFILSVYEMLVLSTSKGWVSHILGLASIMQIRGPQDFQTGFQRLVLDNARILIILASLAVSKGTFLAQSEWKIIPWMQSRPMDPMQGLIEIMTNLPGLKEMQHERNDPLECYSLAKQVLSELLTWRKWWNSTPMSETLIVHSSEQDPFWSEVFETSLYYHSIHAANCTCLYDGAVIQTVEILTATSITSSAFDFDDLLRDAAMEICHSLSYLLSQRNFARGHFMALFPMRMAWKALGGGATSQGRWIEQVLQKVEVHKQSWGITSQTITYPSY
ncbi:hypothetical protein PV10_03029 [Exophiala mesophila]|uniref:Zn(2)-C6 fungal-type domain-containing protein n=1 Tax=Exophiala mesophila TaxID=212818 RepID=A0A0D1ZN30_EXOME|nr:uncharacterized protein PV10_03029 [Exophiala mesophila]KIV95364.1 hypothetical protein PV10_03029 [Exophiala mesophila]